jgi:hypothetical protein
MEPGSCRNGRYTLQAPGQDYKIPKFQTQVAGASQIAPDVQQRRAEIAPRKATEFRDPRTKNRETGPSVRKYEIRSTKYETTHKSEIRMSKNG